MADDLDIPPLEDMTEVLKQASAIRAGVVDTVANDKLLGTAGTAKERAKVKKNIAAKAVNLQKLNSDESAGDNKTTSVITPAAPVKPAPEKTSLPSSTPANISKGASEGVFGGLKKGFLFSGTPKSSSNSSKNKSNVEAVKPVEAIEKPEKKIEIDKMPFISPKSGKAPSGLTIDEVQQAMSEAKGLLDNQDWINDDLLSKVEKNDLLLKRFGDPQFMKALQEFQTNPTAAMEKYKGNREVEKFLTEFCSLLGDHFTNFGSGSENVGGSKTSTSTQPRPSKPKSNISKPSDNKMQPKIVEIVDTKSESTESAASQECSMESKTKKFPKIIELTEKDNSLQPSSEMGALETNHSGAEIMIHSPSEQADIQEMPANDDAVVKDMLNDTQVMEILLDPKVLNLIQLLKTDPEKAQRAIDTADMDLKDKIKFLVSKGLLQLQSC